MTPETQIWRDRLKSTNSRIDAIFPDALEDAQTVLDEDGKLAWLAGADRVSALGRGTELVLIFLTEIPEIVRHTSPQIIPEIAATTAFLSECAVRGSYRPFLATLPAISQRLNSTASLRDWFGLVRKISVEAKEGASALIEHAPFVFGQLSLSGVKNWVNYGVRVYKDHPHRLPDYFSLKSADAKAMLVKERKGTLYMDYERQLHLFARAFWNKEVEFRPYSQAIETKRKPTPHLDRQGIHIPDVYEDFNGVSGIDRYRAMIAHMMAHRIWSTPYLADNFSVFQHICIETFEDARVEHLAMQELPGLRKLWVSLHPAPNPKACPEGWSCIRHKMAMLSYALLNPGHPYSDPILLEAVAGFQTAMDQNSHDANISVELGVNWLRDNHDHSFRQPKVWFQDTEVSFRDDNRFLWVFLEEPDNDDEFHSDHNTADRDVAQPDEGLLPPRHYQEWDYQIQNYRPDWSTVYEAIQPQGAYGAIDELLNKHQGLVKQLKDIVDLLKPQQRRRIRYQSDGDELDLDLAIRTAIDYRIGTIPDTRIYQSHIKDGRDIAVLLLLDISQSVTDVPQGAEQTILQLSLEATSLLAVAVEALGDPFAIAGFSSNTRHEVRYTHFKGFGEHWGNEVKGRLAAAEAGYSTRMGAALRHAGHYLEQRNEEIRLLLVLTDGEPHDIDVADPQYLQKDTHIAVGELDSKGISTYCISLDPKADDYVAEIFGANNYTVIDKIEKLPEKLPRLFMNLTK